MNTHHSPHIRKYSGGYTLLFAVLTAALVLGVAVFILSVSKRQYALSVAARDSMYALYAADSGLECAAATDIATTSNFILHCNGVDPMATGVFVVWANPDVDQWPTSYTGYVTSAVYRAANIVIDLPDSTCAVVTVVDGAYAEAGAPKYKRTIESRGYNYCDAVGHTGPKASSRTVERALRLTYK